MGAHRHRGPTRSRLSPAEADRLLDGGGRRRDLRRLLDAAAALGPSRELGGERGARAAFASAAVGSAPPVRTPRLVTARTIVAGLALVGTATGGVAIAANRSSPAPAEPSSPAAPGIWSGHPAAVVGEAATVAETASHQAARASDPDTGRVTGARIVQECTPPGCGPAPSIGTGIPSARSAEECDCADAADASATAAPGQTRRAETPAGAKAGDSRDGGNG